jgi:hypothetical protein
MTGASYVGYLFRTLDHEGDRALLIRRYLPLPAGPRQFDPRR